MGNNYSCYDCIDDCLYVCNCEIPIETTLEFFEAVKNGNCDKVKELFDPQEVDPETEKLPPIPKIDAGDKNGVQAIHVAAENGHPEMIKLLLELGASPLATTLNGWSPAHSAAMNGHVEALRTLVDQTQEHSTSSIAGGTILNWPDHDYIRPIHAAAGGGHLEVIKYLFHANVSGQQLIPCSRDYFGHYPLTYAVMNNRFDVAKYLMKRIERLHASGKLKFSVEHVINSKTSGSGSTCIHYAANHGSIEMIDLLIEKGAKVNSVNAKRFQVHHFCCEKGHLEALKKFMEIKKKSYYQNTHNNNNADELDISHESLDNAVLQHQQTPTNCNRPSESKKSVSFDDKNKKNNNDQNEEDDHDSVKKQNSRSQDNDNDDNDESNPDSPSKTTPSNQNANGNSIYLLDIEAKGHNEVRCIHLAVANRQYEIVKYLVEEQVVNTKAKMRDGRTPLDLAIEKKDSEMAHLLGGTIPPTPVEEELEPSPEDEENDDENENDRGEGENDNVNDSLQVDQQQSSSHEPIASNEGENDSNNEDHAVVEEDDEN